MVIIQIEREIDMKKRALISVYDKTGILDFAKFLISKGIEIISTGGTYKYLKENKPEVLAIALEPEESPAISKGHGGVHKIQGIGTGFIPENFNKELMDEIYTVSSDEAISETKNFVRTTGIGVGISSGAAIAGAKKVAAKYPDKKIVTILPDGVDKYLSMLEFDEVTYVEV